MAFAVQFVIALLPAIAVEVLLLPSVQSYLVEIGVRAPVDSTDCVAGGDKSIKAQRALDFDAWETQMTDPDRPWSALGATLSNSTKLARLQAPLLFLNLVAATALFYDMYLVPRGLPSLALPTLPFTVSSFALGLLVTFRVNTSSSRYITARNKWGSILNVSRDLSQQAAVWAQRKEDAIDFARWVPVFPLVLMCHLRDPRSHDLRAELQAAAGPPESAKEDARGLSEAEIQEILRRPTGMNAPHFVLYRLRAKISGLGLCYQQRLLMEHNITRLVNDLGACENIFATSVPLGFTKHTTRFLVVWLMLLPFALESQLGFGVVFAQQLLAFGLLGTEDIGTQIEEPFAVLPLKRIASKIALEAQAVRGNAESLNGHGGRRFATVAGSTERKEASSGASSPVLEPGEEPDFFTPEGSIAAEEETLVFESPVEEDLLDLSVGGDAPRSEPETLRSWLETHKLGQYMDRLVEEGYDDLSIMREAEPDEIQDLVGLCGMPAHRAQRFVRAAEDLRGKAGKEDAAAAIARMRQRLERFELVAA